MRDTSFAMLSRLAPKAASTIVFIMLLRRWGATDAGVYALAVALVTAFVLLGSCGLDELLLREVAQSPSLTYPYLINAVPLRALLAALSYGVMAVLLFAIGYSSGIRSFVLIQGIAIVPDSVTASAVVLLMANRRMRDSAIVAGASSVTQLVAGIWAIWMCSDLASVAWMVVASSSVGAVTSLVVTHRLALRLRSEGSDPDQPAGTVSVGFCRSLVVRALPFLLLIGLVSVDIELDVVLLSKLSNAEEVGWYGAARSLVLLFSIIAQSLRMVIYPELAQAYTASESVLRRVYGRVWSLVALVGFPIVVGGIFISGDLLSLVYGNVSQSSVWALRILFGFLLANFLYQPGTRLLIAADRQLHLARLLALGLLVHLACSLLLTPEYGAIGAAASRAFSALLYFVMVERHVGRHLLQGALPVGRIGTLLFSTAVMAFALAAIGASPWYVKVPVGAAVYGALTGVLTYGRMRRSDPELGSPVW